MLPSLVNQSEGGVMIAETELIIEQIFILVLDIQTIKDKGSVFCLCTTVIAERV